MAKCTYCSSTILFGGKRDANGRFCNQKYQGRGANVEQLYNNSQVSASERKPHPSGTHRKDGATVARFD